LLKPCEECTGGRRSLSCEPEQRKLRTVATESAQSRKDSTLEKLLNVEREEHVKSPSKGVRVENLRRYSIFVILWKRVQEFWVEEQFEQETPVQVSKDKF
jgi:hypothetical protein